MFEDCYLKGFEENGLSGGRRKFVDWLVIGLVLICASFRDCRLAQVNVLRRETMEGGSHPGCAREGRRASRRVRRPQSAASRTSLDLIPVSQVVCPASIRCW